MWSAASQNFTLLVERDASNTTARIHRAQAQWKLVCTFGVTRKVGMELKLTAAAFVLPMLNLSNIILCIWNYIVPSNY